MSLTSTITQLPDSEIEISAELSSDEFESYRSKAVRAVNNLTEIDGFRRGHTPDHILVEKVGEIALLEEMASEAISFQYPKLIKEHSLDAIGRPEITITKIAANNPLTFKVKIAIAPVFVLPDYKEIARGVMSETEPAYEATDEEANNIIKELAARRKKPALEGVKPEDMPEPVIDDEFAKSLGSFADLAELRAKIKENVILEKRENERQKRRVAVMDKLVDATHVALPKVIVAREIDHMVSEMRYNLESMGLNFTDYLVNIKKSEEDLRKEYETPAQKRITVKMILKKIADTEKIEVDHEEIHAEVKKITDLYHDVDEQRAHHYAEDVLRDEKTFQLLEGVVPKA